MREMAETAILLERAGKLRSGLTEFAQGDMANDSLVRMLDIVKENCDVDVLRLMRDSESESQKRVDRAAMRCRRITHEGERSFELFAGWGVAVATSTSGEVIGVVCDPPPKKVQNKYYGTDNFNFARAAMSKLVVALYLLKGGRSGGIEDNIGELKAAGFEYHTGATDEPILLPEDTSIVVGASGFEPTFGARVWMEGVGMGRADAIKVGIEATIDPDRHFAQAGRIDTAWAEALAKTYARPATNLRVDDLVAVKRGRANN